VSENCNCDALLDRHRMAPRLFNVMIPRVSQPEAQQDVDNYENDTPCRVPYVSGRGTRVRGTFAVEGRFGLIVNYLIARRVPRSQVNALGVPAILQVRPSVL
jgi:hypothetical protein